MVRLKIKPWVLALGLAAVCVGSILALFAYRNLRGWNAQKMASVLPIEDAVVLYLDVATLRKSGLLGSIAGSKAVEEAEYRKFIDESGFDYKSDLDQIAISFQNKSRYAVALGRFDWTRIKAYAIRSGGQCLNGVCEVKSSDFVDRSLSFYPMHGSAMALSSATGSGGTYSVTPAREKVNEASVSTWPTNAPVWIRVPASVWRDSASLPTGARIFGSALAPANDTFFTIQPVSERQLSLQVEAICTTVGDAQKLHKELGDATALLKKLLAREGQIPKPGDLAQLLTNGTFQIEGTRVKGAWPLELALVHSIFEGEVH